MKMEESVVYMWLELSAGDGGGSGGVLELSRSVGPFGGYGVLIIPWVNNNKPFLSLSPSAVPNNHFAHANAKQSRALTNTPETDKQHDPVADQDEEALIVVTPEEGGRRRRGSRGEVEDDLLDRTGTFRSSKAQWKTGTAGR